MVKTKLYEKIPIEIEKSEKYICLRNELEKIAERIDQTIYILRNPLYNIEGDQNLYESNYVDDGSFAILIPEHKIIFTSITNQNVEESYDEKFNEYVDRFIDSITTLIGVFQFKNKIVNTRKWSRELIEDSIDIKDIRADKLEDISIENDLKYSLELIISLVTGSINKPDRGGKSENLLDAVKRRIVQFDAEQTRFVYDNLKKPVISIQGLAGTGKTELLFHRLVNLYTQTNKKIVFTCYSKILANDIKKRLPSFFDQMKVAEREDVDERIKIMGSWGSKYNPMEGVYSYICKYYDITFTNYNDSIGKGGFEGICKKAIEEIGTKANENKCFEYLLIDEAQDFSSGFFELCKLVTSEQVIIASDIFQSIYKINTDVSMNTDFTLSKVYRTDFRNFMFSQFLGFGIKEKPIINWLSDDAWKISGYEVDKFKNIDNKFMYKFSRLFTTRFKGLDMEGVVPTELIYVDEKKELLSKVELTIDKIIETYPNVEPGDIGIVFVSKKSEGYKVADMIASKVIQKYGWESQKIYENQYKSRDKDKIFISNQNNIKGLEFPFVLALVLDKVTDNVEIRNTLYMILTRSYITSSLFLTSENKDIYEIYQPLLDEIMTTNTVVIEEPKEEDILKEEELSRFKDATLTLEQKMERVLLERELYTESNLRKLKKLVEVLIEDSVVAIESIEEIVDSNRGKF